MTDVQRKKHFETSDACKTTSVEGETDLLVVIAVLGGSKLGGRENEPSLDSAGGNEIWLDEIADEDWFETLNVCVCKTISAEDETELLVVIACTVLDVFKLEE